MQRNFDLIRAILIAVDSAPAHHSFDIQVPGATDEAISYHGRLLGEAGLIVANDKGVDKHDARHWKPTNLTSDGHELLDLIRNDKVWEAAKALMLERTGTLTLAGLKVAVPIVLQRMLEA